MSARNWRNGTIYCLLIFAFGMAFGMACGASLCAYFYTPADALVYTTRQEEAAEPEALPAESAEEPTDAEEAAWPESLLPGEQIDINTAPAKELERLPGIGPTKAEAIVQWRTEHNGFSAPEELMEVRGIGEKTYENLKQYVTVEETNAAAAAESGEEHGENFGGG